MSKIEFVKRKDFEVAKLKCIGVGTSIIVASIVSGPKPAAIKSADDLLKDVMRNFKSKCFLKATRSKKFNPGWR
ncbi:MAG: hypothetical protein WCW43_00265 [Candidatus Paceibacterota bacterium]